MTWSTENEARAKELGRWDSVSEELAHEEHIILRLAVAEVARLREENVKLRQIVADAEWPPEEWDF